MQTVFDLRDNEYFQNGLPDGYRGIILQGAIASFAKSASGLVVLQNFSQSDFSIQLSIFKFLHLVRSILRPPVFAIGPILALKNNFKSTMSEMGTFNLKEGQFSFLHYGSDIILAEFKGGREYHLLEISCSPEMLSQILLYFPKIAKTFQETVLDSSASVLCSQLTATEKALGIVHDILHSHFLPGINDELFEDRVREYLLVLMAEASKAEEPKVKLGNDEKDLLFRIAERMKLFPNSRFPISKLAREMGMNTMTLKMAFKQEFHKGIFEFHLDQRMKESRRLLKESNLNIKTIASMVGYDRATSFITKFSEYFGYPPSRIQKNK